MSAHDEYALDAFEVAATDHLLEPFSEARFALTVQRALAVAARRAPGPGAPADAEPAHVVVHCGRRSLVIDAAAIDWLEASDYYALLHVGGETHLLRETMQELAARLGARWFARIHRPAIVNLRRVEGLERRDATHWLLRLVDGSELPVSRRRHASPQQLLRARRGSVVGSSRPR